MRVVPFILSNLGTTPAVSAAAHKSETSLFIGRIEIIVFP
jgi:hypothetical protein